MRRGKKRTRTNRSKQQIRRSHVKHQHGKCAWCSVKMIDVRGEHPRKATLEHVIPSCFFGRNNYTNTVAACTHCNSTRNQNLPSFGMVINFIKVRRWKSLDILFELVHWYLSINLIKLICEVNYAVYKTKTAQSHRGELSSYQQTQGCRA